MRLRQKLLFPLLTLALLLGGYLYGYWIPRSLAQAESEHLRLTEHHLETVAEGLVPLLLGRELDSVFGNLDALLAQNPDWTQLILRDPEGRQLYPLLAAPERSTSGGVKELRRVASVVAISGRKLGELSLELDLGPTLASDRHGHHELLLLWGLALALLLLTTVTTLEVAVRSPVRRLSSAAQALARQQFDQPLPRPGDDEIGSLVTSFATMRDRLRGYQEELLAEIAERREAQQALRRLNETLEQRVQEEVAKNRDKDHILIQQSRLAAMGEMVHNIAHQWRQPLNALGILISNLSDDIRFGSATTESVDRDVATARRLIERMSTTIDDFRDFFRPDREPVEFEVAGAVRDAVSIVDAALKANRVGLELELEEGLVATGFPNQCAQAVLNLMVNAKEALVSGRTDPARISVRLTRSGNDALVTVEDNGGGIPGEILPQVFDPYFTTKEQGSGIGLYMVKAIIEKNMGGRVEAANSEEGARLTLRIPLRPEP